MLWFRLFIVAPDLPSAGPPPRDLRWTPLCRTAQNFAQFFLSRSMFSLFFTLGRSSRRFVKPQRPLGPLGLAQGAPRRTQTRNLGGPWPRPAATNPREDPRREKKRENMGAGEEKKARNFWATRRPETQMRTILTWTAPTQTTSQPEGPTLLSPDPDRSIPKIFFSKKSDFRKKMKFHETSCIKDQKRYLEKNCVFGRDGSFCNLSLSVPSQLVLL